jgi:hypothetical protein
VIRRLYIENKDAAIADFAGSGGFREQFDDVIGPVIVDCNLDHDFRQQRQMVFNAAVNGRVPALPAMSPNFRYGHSWNHRHELCDDIIQLFRANDALDHFHGAAFISDFAKGTCRQLRQLRKLIGAVGVIGG